MEIERNPVPPDLNETVIRLLTKLCFRKNDNLKKVDGIFVFASIIGIDSLVELIEEIISKKVSNKLFITGGITPKKLAKDLGINIKLTEADTLFNELKRKQYKNLEVFIENKSTNTLENVTETLKNPEFRKCKSLLFIFKSHATGRGYLTLKKYFKSEEILQQSFDTKYEQADKIITRDNWYTFAFGRKRVWGEYLRIKTYGSRGDIEYDSVKELIEKIEKEI